MDIFESFRSQLYTVNASTFDNIALTLFTIQAAHNPVYGSYLGNLGILPSKVSSVDEIPFMPVGFFRNHPVKTGAWKETAVFTSSGTSGGKISSHFVLDPDEYHAHARRCFEHFFGPIHQYEFFALLPSYLERKSSSLVDMMAYFLHVTGAQARFYLNDTPRLIDDLSCVNAGKTPVLFGVTFALLDLARRQPDLSKCIVVETGGMKGRGRELTRQEVHTHIREACNQPRICSEYGMTELFSQAYAIDNEAFNCPPWMKVIGRDPSDPFQKGLRNETAGINIIDLANWSTSAFIETEDLGKVGFDGSFEVLGRMDNSEIRGCNLLVQ